MMGKIDLGKFKKQPAPEEKTTTEDPKPKIKKERAKNRDANRDATAIEARIQALETQVAELNLKIVTPLPPNPLISAVDLTTIAEMRAYLAANAPVSLQTWIGQGRHNIVQFFTNMVNELKYKK